MKFSFLIIPFLAVVLVACGKADKPTSDDRMPDITQKQWDQSEMNKKRDRCIRQNQNDGTNIDCYKKYPKQPG